MERHTPMSANKAQRELENEYFTLTLQIAELVKRKTSLAHLDVEISQTHRQLMEMASDSDFLATANQALKLLRDKSRVHTIELEFQQIRSQMQELGCKLGWSGQLDADSPEDDQFSERMSRLQSEIEQLQTSLV